jgi:phage shock protein A
MKPLSKSLTELAARVKQLEDSAAAVQDRNQAALQKRREELDAAIDRQVQEFNDTTTETKEAARSWWSDTRGSIERQIAAMRADFDTRRSEHEQHKIEEAAQAAEEDAVLAVTLATYCVDAAEWAVMRAVLARGEADQLAVGS